MAGGRADRLSKPKRREGNRLEQQRKRTAANANMDRSLGASTIMIQPTETSESVDETAPFGLAESSPASVWAEDCWERFRDTVGEHRHIGIWEKAGGRHLRTAYAASPAPASPREACTDALIPCGRFYSRRTLSATYNKPKLGEKQPTKRTTYPATKLHTPNHCCCTAFMPMPTLSARMHFCITSCFFLLSFPFFRSCLGYFRFFYACLCHLFCWLCDYGQSPCNITRARYPPGWS